jgi:hypothetical protein
VRWFAASVFLLATLWAAIAYAAVAAMAELFSRRARLFAAPAAVLAAVVVGAGLWPIRPTMEHTIATLAPVAADKLERHVSCVRPMRPAHHVMRGVLDVVHTVADSVPLKDRAVLNRHDVLVLQGWATDAATRRPVVAVCLLVDGKPPARQRASYGADRPDVARAFGVADIAPSGFDIQLNAVDLTSGVHELVVVGVDDRGLVEPIANPRRVVIR